MKKQTRKLLVITLISLLFLIPVSISHASTLLWYNGDLDYGTGLSSESNTRFLDTRTYDDFIVPVGGWTIDSVFSNILADFSTTQGAWEIRSGLFAGNGGTLIAYGTGNATQVATGNTDDGYNEYLFTISGLDISLSQGTYWLTIAPIGSGNESEEAFVVTTSGDNAVGSPMGNNGNAFFDFDSNNVLLYHCFDPVVVVAGSHDDYSYGIYGSNAVPEPASMLLFGSGLFGLVGAGIKKRKVA